MGLKCPKCAVDLEVRLTAAPPMQADQATKDFPNAEGLEDLLDAINDESLGGKDADFVADMRDKFRKYGVATFVSDKQRAWLKSLAR